MSHPETSHPEQAADSLESEVTPELQLYLGSRARRGVWEREFLQAKRQELLEAAREPWDKLHLYKPPLKLV